MRKSSGCPPDPADELHRLRQRVAELEQKRATSMSGAPLSAQPLTDHFRLLYENTPSMSFALAPDGTTLSVNQFGAEQLGYASEQLIGQSVLLVFDPADHQTVRQQLIACTQSPYKIFQWDIQKVHRSGRRLWVKETARAVRDSHGDLIVLVMCEDITTKKAAEERTHSLTTALEALIRTSPLAIMALDPSGETVTLWNHAAETMFGWSEQEVLGWPAPFLPPSHRDESDRLWNQLLEQGQLQGAELRRVRKDGTPIDLSLWATVLRDQRGNIVSTFGLLADITSRKQAEEALQASEARFRQIAETIEEVVWSADPEIGKMLYISPAYERVWGRTCASLYEHPKSFFDGIHPDDRERIAAGLAVQRDGLPFAHEYRVVRPDGTIRWVWDRGFPIRDGETGHLTHYVGVALDITERKQAEEALRVSEERFAKAFRSSPHPIIVTELATGRCLEANDASLQLFGFQRQEVIGQSTLALGLWPNPAERKRFVDRLSAEGSFRNLDMTFNIKDRTERRFLVSCELIELNGTKCMVTVGTDITEQKRAEEALRRSELELRRAFEERERLSQDLHDNLLQSLYAVGMGLELTKQRMRRISQTDAKRLEGSVGQLNALIRGMRDFIPRMHVPTAQTGSTADALRSLVDSFVSTGAGPIALTIDEEAALRLSPEQTAHLLAIAKEALSNSFRHAKAVNRSLTLQLHRGNIRLEVADDGKGFLLRKKGTVGMGIRNMRSRAAKLNARLAIRTSLKKGTRITLDLRRPF